MLICTRKWVLVAVTVPTRHTNPEDYTVRNGGQNPHSKRHEASAVFLAKSIDDPCLGGDERKRST